MTTEKMDIPAETKNHYFLHKKFSSLFIARWAIISSSIFKKTRSMISPHQTFTLWEHFCCLLRTHSAFPILRFFKLFFFFVFFVSKIIEVIDLLKRYAIEIPIHHYRSFYFTKEIIINHKTSFPNLWFYCGFNSLNFFILPNQIYAKDDK